MQLDVSTTACLDLGRVQGFKTWFLDRTGVSLDLGEAFAFYCRYEKGENVLALADQIRADRLKEAAK